MMRKILFAILAPAFAAAGAADDPRLRISEQVGIFWIDRSQVLYEGFPSEVLEKMAAGTLTYKELFQSPNTIRSFNIQTGEIRDRAVNHRGAFCYRDGNVLYQKRDSARAEPYYVFGPLDQDLKPSPSGDDINKGTISFTRCYSPDVSHLPGYPSDIVPLLEAHGFVELRRSSPERPKPVEHEILLYKPGSHAPIPVRGYRIANAQSLSWGAPGYAPWKDAYFVYTVGVRGAVGNSAWWLYPDGKTEKVVIPEGSWNDYSRTNASFYPTKCGLLINITYSFGELLVLRKKRSLLGSDTYSDPERLLPGRVWQLAVSPDGMKVAVAAGATSIPSTNPSTLRVLEVCKE